jgi:hypothetical protein
MFSQAQDQKAKAPVQDKWQVSGGYTFTRTYGMWNYFSVSSSSDNFFAGYNANGGQAAISYFPLRHFGLTYQMTFNGTGNRSIESSSYTQSTNSQSYEIGPAFRYAFKLGQFKGASVFAHQLFGATHDGMNFSAGFRGFCGATSSSTGGKCSANAFSLTSGGGIDYKVSSHFSIRPVQVEYFNQEVPYSLFSNGVEGASVRANAQAAALRATPEAVATPVESMKFGVNGLRYSAGMAFNF